MPDTGERRRVGDRPVDEHDVLACPRCGERSLLANGTIMVEVLDTPGVCGRPYGTPEVVPLSLRTPVVCNRTKCQWRGILAEARG